MNMVKIFYKDDCPLCPMAKKLKNDLIKEKIKVIDYNVGTADGLAEATFYGIKALPTIIIEDEKENELMGWRGVVPNKYEVINAVKG